MIKFDYIMVTGWGNHWDNLIIWENSTLFTLPFIKDDIQYEKYRKNATALLIKKNGDEFEKSWIGTVYNFRNDYYNGKKAIRFDVANVKEVICPELFKGLKLGWYKNKLKDTARVSLVKENTIKRLDSLQISKDNWNTSNLDLIPPFFNKMSNDKPFEFENNCHLLLKSLGINDIHKVPQVSSAGKCDGFFISGNLAVIYDATLNSKYIENKDTQISNYISQINKDNLESDSISYTIKDKQKQIWIITRGENNKLLKTVDGIRIKEISYLKLIELYQYRMTNEVNNNSFTEKLINL